MLLLTNELPPFRVSAVKRWKDIDPAKGGPVRMGDPSSLPNKEGIVAETSALLIRGNTRFHYLDRKVMRQGENRDQF